MIVIPYNTPSSKNSKIVTKHGAVIMSKLCYTWLKNTKSHWVNNKELFEKQLVGREPPYHVVFGFVRDTRRKFDYINALQIVADTMVKYEWLIDDDCNNLIPYFLPHRVDKANCGCYIQVIDPISMIQHVKLSQLKQNKC
jgi:hypothetical protein